MGIIVQKFGGSSVANTEKLFNVCNHVTREYDAGHSVIVVVSAQGKTTDGLINQEKEITEKPSKREHDTLVASGEQISSSKLAMCLETLGYQAVSLMGWQIPIITDAAHGNARIKYINSDRIEKELQEGKIVIVAGFQGIDENANITTLGRGGSDTTAVALAAALHAERCEIYTDVDGIYSSDPNIIKYVTKIDTISYDEMLELASLGAKVLHNRCVELGKKYHIPIYVKSSFMEESRGTIVAEQTTIEGLTITGVAKDDNVSKITIEFVPNSKDKTYKIFDLLAQNNINVDIIVQVLGKQVSFTIKTTDLKNALDVLNRNREVMNAENILHSEEFSKVSIVGIGIENNPGVAAKMFSELNDNNITIHLVTTSETKISVLVEKEDAQAAMKVVHDAFICEK